MICWILDIPKPFFSADFGWEPDILTPPRMMNSPVTTWQWMADAKGRCKSPMVEHGCGSLKYMICYIDHTCICMHILQYCLYIEESYANLTWLPHIDINKLNYPIWNGKVRSLITSDVQSFHRHERVFFTPTLTFRVYIYIWLEWLPLKQSFSISDNGDFPSKVVLPSCHQLPGQISAVYLLSEEALVNLAHHTIIYLTKL